MIAGAAVVRTVAQRAFEQFRPLPFNQTLTTSLIQASLFFSVHVFPISIIPILLPSFSHLLISSLDRPALSLVLPLYHHHQSVYLPKQKHLKKKENAKGLTRIIH